MFNKKHVHVNHSKFLKKFETKINSIVKRSMKDNILKKANISSSSILLYFPSKKAFLNGQCRTIKKFGKFCTFGCKNPFAFAICEKWMAKIFNLTFVSLSRIPFIKVFFTWIFV